MHKARTVFDRVLVVVGVIALWQLASFSAGAYWVPAPWPVVQALWAMAMSGELARHASYTFQAAAWGFLIGGLPGAVLPFILRRMPRLSAILDPYLVGGYGIPKLALAPLFILWFGIGLESKIAVVASVVFFLVFFNTTAGVRAIDAKLVQMARLVGASEWLIARRVIWPSAVPFIFAGLRVSTPYAIGGAVIAELISSNRGLGYLVQLGAMNFKTVEVFAAILAITLIVIGANALVNGIERRLLRWRPAHALNKDAASGGM